MDRETKIEKIVKALRTYQEQYAYRWTDDTYLMWATAWADSIFSLDEVTLAVERGISLDTMLVFEALRHGREANDE